MVIIDIYLAHRNSIKFIAKQVLLINKYFKCNEDSKINLYGYVDGSNENVKNVMRQEWTNFNVTPIEIPEVIDNFNRNNIGPSESFGLAFTYVYENYILKNKSY